MVPLAELPDSPSVYSHVYHSPDPLPRPSPDLLDDETASRPTNDMRDDSDVDDCTDGASYRVSLPGPRIRFHSLAPWETDDVVPHTAESDNSPSSTVFRNKLREKSSRADSLFRTLTRRPSAASRPSVDSARSQASSLEFTSGSYSGSRGALYDLAKESMSTSSLSSSSTSASFHQQNYNHPNSSHYFTRTLPRTTVSLDRMAPPPTILENVPMLPLHTDTFRNGQKRSASPSAFIHPYANPDLMVLHTPSPETIPSHHSILTDMSGSDSNSTVADSTSIKSAAFSVISTDTSTTSLTSRDSPSGNNPRLNGKEISSPMSLLQQNDSGYVDRNTRFLSLHPPPATFDGSCQTNPRSPTITLISLQEAQARERVRCNTVHTTVSRSSPPFPGTDDIFDTTEDQSDETDTVGALACTRTRSISAGTQQTTVSPPMGEGHTVSMSTNAVPGRALKHKKSGFMRLFTGRNPEGEKERNLPPSNPLTGVYVKPSLPMSGKTSKSTPSKAPKPSFSPTLPAPGASNTSLASANSVLSGDVGANKGHSSRRRQPPPLSIVTRSSDHRTSFSLTGRSSSTGLTYTSPAPQPFSVPQSAPPGDTDFLALKLRPVSTSFSSHFVDMVADAVGELRRDVHTPDSATSSSTALSPFTPVSLRRSDGALTTVETRGEEYLTVRGLQDQLVSRQQQIWELHGRIRDLTSELEDLRAAGNQEYCEACGRGKSQRRHAPPSDEQQLKKAGVVNRPRARTGDTARFASGN